MKAIKLKKDLRVQGKMFAMWIKWCKDFKGEKLTVQLAKLLFLLSL